MFKIKKTKNNCNYIYIRHHHRHNRPFWAKAFFRSFWQLSLFLSTFLQFLYHKFLCGIFLQTISQLSFGLPLCLLPSTTTTRTLPVALCSSIPITCPADFNQLKLMYVTISLSLYSVYNLLLYFILHSHLSFAAIQLTVCTVPKATHHTACCYSAHSLYCSKSHSSHCLLLYSSEFVLFQKPLNTLPAAIQLTICTILKATHHTACCYTAHSLYCSKSHSTHCLLLFRSQFLLF